MTSRHSSSGLRRALGDFTIVVVGVFVALAAESWWSTREERLYERELRADMLTEFDTNLRILEADLAINDTAVVRMTSWNELDEHSLQAIAPEEFTAISPRWAGFDPEMGSVRALVDSGGLSSISDRELRTLVARWAGLLQENRRFNLQAVEFQLHVLLPTVARSSGDGQWTVSERTEARSLLRELSILALRVIESQRKLVGAAQGLRAYLLQDG